MKRVRISTPSRLHFGLLRFRTISGPSYGGLGVMIDWPRFVVEMQASDRWSVVGPLRGRAEGFAKLALQRLGRPNNRPSALRIEIPAAISQHCGLGGGTQLGLAIAAGVSRLCGSQEHSLQALVAAVDRGRRSAVGSHGFQQGGLIWEAGRQGDEPLGRLAERIAVPRDWRFVLISDQGTGLSGPAENSAFETLPPVPRQTTSRLCELVERRILPALKSKNIGEFGEGVYQYGRLAGECFASAQGGAYASPGIAERVRQIRKMGIAGVGQSSWGPTIFAAVANQRQAEDLVERLQGVPSGDQVVLQIVAPDNRGAAIEDVSAEPALHSPHRPKTTTIYSSP